MSTGGTCPHCGGPQPGGICVPCLARTSLGAAEPPPEGEEGTPLAGDYLLLAPLARGGMGIVFKARQRSLNRLVAVKMLLAGQFAEPEELRRFQAEAEAAARLEHPGIVPIFEVGEEDGRPFFSMKLVEGGSLATRLTTVTDPMPPAAAARLVSKVARAVHYAHQRGFIHRDLKPANILLDAGDEPLVTDFGLAKRIGPEAGSQRTLSGAVMGTPGYMAPEQAQGDPGVVSTAADVFSLGAILHHLLSGKPPFHAPTAAETMRRVLEAEPAPLAASGRRIDRDLETICRRCLEKEPAARYGSAEGLADDLERWLRHEPIQARPVGLAGRLRKWVRRRPGMAALGGAAAGIALAGVAGVFHQWQRAEAALRESRQSLWTAEAGRARSGIVSGRLGQRVESLAAIRSAVALRPSPELRTEAVAALALTDVAPTGQPLPVPADAGAVTFSEDFSHLLSETERESVVRRLPGGEAVFRLSTEQHSHTRALSADGSWLFRLTDAGLSVVETHAAGRSHRLARTPERPELRSPHFSADGALVLWTEPKGCLCELSLADGAVRTVRDGLRDPWTCRLSPDGLSVLVETDTDFQLLEHATGATRRTFARRTGVGAVVWTPDGTAAAIGYLDGVISLVKVSTGQTLTLRGHSREITGLWFDGSGTLLLSHSWDNTTRLWDTAGGTGLWEASGLRPGGFTPDGRHVAVSHRTGTELRPLLRPDVCRLVGSAPRWLVSTRAASFSSDSRRLLAVNAQGVQVIDPETGRVTAEAALEDARGAWFLPGDSAVLQTSPAGAQQRPFTRGDGRDALGAPLPLPTVPTTGLGAGDFDPQRQRLVAAAVDRPEALVFSTAAPTTSPAKLPLPESGDPVFCPDGRWIAAGCWDPAVSRPMRFRVWDATTLTEVHAEPSRRCRTTFSADARALLVSRPEEDVLLEVGTWRKLWSIAREEPLVEAGHAAFSADGALLAVPVNDRVVRLVDPATGRELCRLTAPDRRIVGAVRFSPDGRWLAVTTEANLQLWDVPRLRAELRALGLGWESAAAR